MDDEHKPQGEVHKPVAETTKTSSPKTGIKRYFSKKTVKIGGTILIVAILVVAGILIFGPESNNNKDGVTNNAPAEGPAGDADSLDPVQKGLASTNGKCEGKGSTKMAYAPMAAKDIGTIAPMGGYGGSHVTPIDHQYYYQVDPQKPIDTYPVYAVMDGFLNSMGEAKLGPDRTDWNITLSHSCTFMVMYNLMTSIAPEIKAQLPDNWKQMGGAIKVPVKAGQIIGYVGGRSLDFQVADTTFTNPKLLYHTAYNNREPFKINTVHPLDYFTDSVKNQILPFYIRTAEPRDGNYAYDVDGQAVGTWFKAGTNGYAGGFKADGTTEEHLGHLSLAYDSFDPSALILSTGTYKPGQPGIFTTKGSVDWTKITPSSGVAKVELAGFSLLMPNGQIWTGQKTSGITVRPNVTKATALIQLTEKQVMKFELFPDKTPSQVTDFTSAAVLYNRGQDAKMVKSTTASQAPN